MSEDRGLVENVDAHSRLIIPTELTAEASTMLLGGRADGIEAVQHKIATALQDQGVQESAAGNLAGHWVNSFVEAVGAAESPEDSMAHAGRLMNATAARMAQVANDAAPLTAEQRLMTALTQGHGVSDPAAGGGGGAAPLNKALFDGVMDQLSRPAGGSDPIAALSQALNAAPPVQPTADPSTLSPAEKLAQALASGGAVPQALKALGPAASTDALSDFEQALSSGTDVASSIATAEARMAHAGTQARTAAVEPSSGDRLLTALASGQTDAVQAVGGRDGAFTGTLNDALARGAAPDAALGASARAQADMATLVDGAATAPKPGDALTAALASGRNVAETVKSFAAATGANPAMDGHFGQALAAALSSGNDAAHALGAAHQNAATVAAVLSTTAQGVKSSPLMAALASGENVQSAVQALGGDGAFGAALGQALASGQSLGQAMTAARQAADTAQQNAHQSAVPVSAENKALADLATPKTEGEPHQVAEASDKKDAADKPAKEAPAKAAEDGQATDKGAEKAAEKSEDGDPKDSAAAESTEGGSKTASDAPHADAPKMDVKMVDLASFTASGDKGGVSAAGDVQAPSPSTLAGTPSVTSALTTTLITNTNMTTNTTVQPTNNSTVPTVAKPVVIVPGDVGPSAPVAATDFDAQAFAQTLAIAEGTTAPAGFTVFHLIEAMFRPGKAGSTIVGLALVANPGSPMGLWQYSVDGSDWLAVGAVSDGGALVLPGRALLRFLPTDDMFGTAPSLGLRALNESWTGGFSGPGRTLIALTDTGGVSAVSAGVVDLTLVVTPVNDAPVAIATTATLAPVAEDTKSPAGASVSSLFGALFSDAVDALPGASPEPLAGIAIVGNPATADLGVWQYWDGSDWRAVGSVSEGSALLVAADGKLRFVPAADWNGAVPPLTVRLVDGSGGAVQTGAHVDLTQAGVGGITPYSAAVITLSSSVTPVNDAPIATGTAVTLDTIAEDAGNPAGASVSSLFGGLFSDPVDAVPGGSSAHHFAGVAIVGNTATASQGVWQYWNGSAWSAVGTVSEGSALLVASGSMLRFLPAADWNGTTPALTVRLIDDSSGAVATGTRVSLADGVGNTTPYSAGTIALTQTVTPVNDAPVATATTATLDAVAEDTAAPAGATVSSLFSSLFSDAADAVSGGSTSNAFAGIVIVGNAATASQGVWQYWDGSGWRAVGTVSEGAALVVSAADKLRFVPAHDWNGTVPALTVRLVEEGGSANATTTTTTTGAVVDLTATGVGGSTRYSAETIALTQEVTPVNDAPDLHADTHALSTVTGVAVAVTGLSVSDIDAGSTPILVTLTAGHGTLTLADGGTDAVITGNGTGTVTVRATLDVINSLLAATDGLRYTAASYTGTDTITVVVDDQGGGGDGGALTATTAITVTVAPPNASPVLHDIDLSISTAAEASAVPTAGTAGIAVSKLVGLNGGGVANVSDSDGGAVTGVALVGTDETYGHWWFSTDGGATWALVGAVNDTDAALLLRPEDRLYFQPNASVPGDVADALTIRAWDQTTGTHGTKTAVDTGAGSAFSGDTDTVMLHPGVLLPNGSFDHNLDGWLVTGGTSVTGGGDGHQATLTSVSGKPVAELESYLGLSTGSLAAATGTTPSAGHAMKLGSTITVDEATTLTFDWSFDFTDNPSFPDFGFVSVNGVITVLGKAADASGTFHVTIPAHTTLTLGFGVSDANDTSVSPTLTIDNIRLTANSSGSTVMALTSHTLSLHATSEMTAPDLTDASTADQTGSIEPASTLPTGTDAGGTVPDSSGTGSSTTVSQPGEVTPTTTPAGSTATSDGGATVNQTPEPTSTAATADAQPQTAGALADTTASGGTVQSLAAESATPDYTAMLQSALGTPDATMVPQDHTGTEASAWVADVHDPAAQPHQSTDPQVAHAVA